MSSFDPSSTPPSPAAGKHEAKRTVDVTLYTSAKRTLPGTLHCDPTSASDVDAVRRLLMGPEPYLRFDGRFGEFFMVSAANVEAVLLEDDESTASRDERCFVTTRGGHTFVGAVGGDMTTDRLSDAVQEPWLRFHTDRGFMLVNSQHVQWIKT